MQLVSILALAPHITSTATGSTDTNDLSRQPAEQALPLPASRYYVTPKSFLDLVASFGDMLAEKRGELTAARDRLLNGVAKLRETNAQVAVMQQELAALQPVLADKSAATERLLQQVGRCTVLQQAAVSC